MQLVPNQRVIVMGLARSGEAVAKLLLRHGCTVTVNERRERTAQDDTVASELEGLGATVVFGGHPLSLLTPQPDFIVKNPGIPYSVPFLVEAQRLGIPVYTEIEISSWLTESPIVAITGSNGKTTTTTLVGEMLAQADLHPVVAGNIGRVLSGVVEQVTPIQPIVLEVSSFQLMGTQAFHPKVAALLNLYPAHLDYHETFESYFDAKWKIFRNMMKGDTAVLNYDQLPIRERARSLSADVWWFSRQTAVEQGVYVDNGQIVLRVANTATPVMAVDALALRGEHNLENALAATALAVAAGATVDAVRHVLTRFRGIEHRLEFVREKSGVDYYNDSKATNPTAALQALRSFPGNIVWIAGGLNRGDDFHVMEPDLKARVKAALLLGQSADALNAACLAVGIPHIERVTSIEQAVLQASRLAEAGDVVLLTPACASWDMFASFEERGRIFKEAVHKL